MATVCRGAAALAVAVAACGSPDPAFTNTLGDQRRCTTVDAPLAALDARSAEEPRLKVPQPPGWETTAPDQWHRFALANPAVAATVTVALSEGSWHDVPAGQSGADLADRVLDTQSQSLFGQTGATHLDVTRGQVCGYPALTSGYIAAPEPGAAARATTQLAAVAQTGSATFYLATLELHTVDPDNAGYQRDAQTILTGFQLLPPP